MDHFNPFAPDPRMKAILERAQRAAEPCGGIIHRRTLLALGLSDDSILRWRALGLLKREARWVYSLCGSEIRQTGRLWGALLSVGGDAAITGPQAIDLLDLHSEVGRPVHVIMSTGRPRPQPGIEVRRTTRLPASDVVEVDGMRCTSAPRTLFDSAHELTTDRLRKLLDRTIQLRLFDRGAFERLSEQWPTAPGRIAMEGAIASLDEMSGRNREELERRMIALIRASHIPNPAINARVHGWEVDGHWIGTRAIVEADGGRYHSSPLQIAQDIAKQKALEALGYVILRLDWKAVVYRPEETIARVEAFRVANLAPPVLRVA